MIDPPLSGSPARGQEKILSIERIRERVDGRLCAHFGEYMEGTPSIARPQPRACGSGRLESGKTSSHPLSPACVRVGEWAGPPPLRGSLRGVGYPGATVTMVTAMAVIRVNHLVHFPQNGDVSSPPLRRGARGALRVGDHGLGHHLDSLREEPQGAHFLTGCKRGEGPEQKRFSLRIRSEFSKLDSDLGFKDSSEPHDGRAGALASPGPSCA